MDLFKSILSYISPLDKAIPLVNKTWHKTWRGRVVHLHLTYRSNADERGIKKLVAGLQAGDFNHLTHLSLDRLYNTDYVISILSAAPVSLKQLSYRNGYVREKDYQKLEEALCRFLLLEKLNLSHFRPCIEHKSGKRFSIPELSCKESLKSLSLVDAAIECFPFFPNLQHLDVYKCRAKIVPEQFSTLNIIRCKDNGPKLPLDFIGRIYTQSEICDSSDAELDALLNAGADIDCPDSLGRTALHLIDWEKATWVQIKRFLDRGAEINYSTENDITPLICWAGRSPFIEIGEQLLQRNADIHQSYEISRMWIFATKRALECAASSDNIPVEKVKLLLKRGANPNFGTFVEALHSRKRLQVIWTLTVHKVKNLALSLFRSIKKRVLSPSLRELTFLVLGTLVYLSRASISNTYFKIAQKPQNR